MVSKLIYRGRNQHRRDRCYQKLTRVLAKDHACSMVYCEKFSVFCLQVSKELRIYEKVALANFIRKFVKSFRRY